MSENPIQAEETEGPPARQPRKGPSSWNRSQSDGFRPIKQVGVAISIGFPLLVVGVVLLVSAFGTVSSTMWIVAGALVLVGLLAGISSKIV